MCFFITQRRDSDVLNMHDSDGSTLIGRFFSMKKQDSDGLKKELTYAFDKKNQTKPNLLKKAMQGMADRIHGNHVYSRVHLYENSPCFLEVKKNPGRIHTGFSKPEWEKIVQHAKNIAIWSDEETYININGSLKAMAPISNHERMHCRAVAEEFFPEGIEDAKLKR